LRQLSAYEKLWPVAGTFTISRSSLDVIPTVWVEITENGLKGRAECRPYERYGDTVESVMAEIDSLKPLIEAGTSREDLSGTFRPGPARNAIDCALWDLEAKQKQVSVSSLLGLNAPKERITAFTLSVQPPDSMADAALKAVNFPLLKIKVNNDIAIACCLAVIKARPDAQLIIDANESLELAGLKELIRNVPHESIAMIEQPIHADAVLEENLPTTIVICADESLHSDTDIGREHLTLLWAQGYRAINLKLDKCGGLTSAYALAQLAKGMGFKIMAGCMVGSSLAMAPMLILESLADVMDMDGPLLLSEDCDNPLNYDQATVYPPDKKLWG